MQKLVIHNPAREDRWKIFLDEMSIQNCEDYIVMPAVLTGNPTQNISQAHKNCVRYAKENNLKHILIMEDDVKFTTPNSLKEFTDLLGDLPNTWNMFLAGVYDGTINELGNNIAEVTQFSGLHCYIVNHTFYDTFLASNEGYNLDRWLSHKRWGNHMAHLAYPMLAIQHDGYSDNAKQITDYNSSLLKRFKINTIS